MTSCFDFAIDFDLKLGIYQRTDALFTLKKLGTRGLNRHILLWLEHPILDGLLMLLNIKLLFLRRHLQSHKGVCNQIFFYLEI